MRIAPGLVFLVLLGGCGGDDSGQPLQIAVRWGARSRVLNAPSSALSALISILRVDPAGHERSFTVDRIGDLPAFTQTYTAPFRLQPGAYEVSTTFYALTGGQGAEVGTAQGTVSLDSSGNAVLVATTYGAVVSVAIPSGQSIRVGEKKDLVVDATDAGGVPIAITQGAIFYTVVGGADKLRITGGQPQGLALGIASLTATVDGITSDPQDVRVVP